MADSLPDSDNKITDWKLYSYNIIMDG